MPVSLRFGSRSTTTEPRCSCATDRLHDAVRAPRRRDGDAHAPADRGPPEGPSAGRRFADWQLDLLAAQGFTDVVYSVGHLGGMLRDFVGDGARWGVRVAWSDEGDEL